MFWRSASSGTNAASHNPCFATQDNGIKVFGSDGYKLADAIELGIEQEIFRYIQRDITPKSDTLPPVVQPEFVAEYEEFLRQAVSPLDLTGLRILLDCANGASSAIAPDIFTQLGAQVVLSHAQPDGRNINRDCGALHPEIVAAATREQGADLGITFDGDADRALFADANGNVVNGDGVLLLAARDLQRRGELNGNLVIGTTMANMGLEAALRADGIRMLRAPVGDKYVLEWMQRYQASLGGEQSGHILFPALSTTGDGLLTGLVVLDILRRSGKPLHELTADLKVYPQVIVNVKVKEKRPLEQFAKVVQTIQQAESELNGNGRVVVRYSGTEALARVMIEAESRTAMQFHADRIATAIRAELGI
ncbi:Phosphoglucosamine mutase [Acidisarcina polymorpha]|uniref:Phosphoglucosamine mutase n=1 Tax=Acidisarcina polymorpha TaxID=2211140 RepID=A0A2Z5G105_9BACT|nr:Phosphoglucosamine mutase [Acidisarcina polymorpha]